MRLEWEEYLLMDFQSEYAHINNGPSSLVSTNNIVKPKHDYNIQSHRRKTSTESSNMKDYITVQLSLQFEQICNY